MKRIVKVIAPAILLAAAAVLCTAKIPVLNEPVYDPSKVVDIRGVVAELNVVPVGSPLEGVHAIVKTKTETLDVFLAPPSFLSMLRFGIKVGDDVHIIGSRVVGNIVLTREISRKYDSIVLRDAAGEPVWLNWGVAIDPTVS